MDTEEIEKNFEFIKKNGDVIAVLVFGSKVKGKDHARSDTDICIITPDAEPMEVMSDIWTNVNTESKGYDVHLLQEFPLHIKKSVIDDHEIIWTRDFTELQDHFYRFIRLWKDQSKARGVT